MESAESEQLAQNRATGWRTVHRRRVGKCEHRQPEPGAEQRTCSGAHRRRIGAAQPRPRGGREFVLDGVEDAAVEDAVNRSALGPTTWILLYAGDAATGVRAELSHPNMTDDSFVSHWQERIIIPTDTPPDETLPLETPIEDVPFDIREA